MAGPWEKYASQDSPKPWEKYASAAKAQASGDSSPDLSSASDADKVAFQKQQIDNMNESGDASNNALFNTLTMGHLPQIKAKAKQIFSGQGIANDQNYVDLRDQEIANQKALAEKYPGANREGTAVGFIAPMLATGGTSAAPEALAEGVPAIGGQVAAQAAKQGALTAVAKGAGTGAAMGAAQNPGDTQGVVDPLQLEARAKNAGVGAAFGGTIGLAANKLPDVADKVSGFANSQAFKATGAMLKDYRKAYANDSIEATGKFALDHGLVQAGDTFEHVADKATALRNQTGDELGKGYDAAAQILPKLGPEATAKVDAAGFNPVRDKAAILSQVKNELGYSFKGKQALQSVSDYLDQLAEHHGDTTLDPKTTNQIKTALDQSAINWERNPLAREPDSEAALKTLRGVLNDKVGNQIQTIGDVVGNPEAAKNLSDLNSKYGMASKIARTAGDRANREGANRAMSLTDTISGVGGAGVGAVLGGWGGAEVGGAAASMANKAARKYGPAMSASVANKIGQVLEASPELSALQSNPGAYKAVTGSPGSVAERAANTSVANNDSNPPPTKGPEKWASDGFDKLMSHSAADPSSQAALEQMKSEMIKDPKMKDLLIQASDFKPGSKGMENILAKIKAAKEQK
jgi:hypothetical protein